MIVVELSVSPNYVHWDVWPCLREFLQNTKDADDLGNKMLVSYDDKAMALSIVNIGAKLNRANLVLGGSIKKGNESQRGQYGEGMKIAIANLLRLGRKVVIGNDNEIWTPAIVKSDTFNTNVLQLTISGQKSTGMLAIVISPISPQEWSQASNNILFMPDSTGHGYDVKNGKMLTDPIRANKLYSQGIYVSDMQEKYLFGYDFKNLQLDRDRKMVDSFYVRAHVKNALEWVATSGQITPATLFDILRLECGESNAIKEDAIGTTKRLGQIMLEEFERRYGQNALPASSPADQLALSNSGMLGILLSAGLTSLITRTGSATMNMKMTKSLSVIKKYALQELTEQECKNFLWAASKVYHVEKFDAALIQIVDFAANNIYGSYHKKDGTISIARRFLKDRKELIATVVHEAAHKYGDDGTPQHRVAIERIFSELVCQYEESANS